MFHRYVEDENGNKIDFDRAAWLMNKDLFKEATDSLPAALGETEFDHFIYCRMGFPPAKPKTDAERLQALYDNYCAKHENKYGKPFKPDVM